MFTKARRKNDDSAAMIRSQASASAQPIPAAGAVDRREHRLRHLADREDRSGCRARRAERRGRAPPSASARCSRRSAPDENARPAPVIITARTSSSTCTSASASRRASPSSSFHEFRVSGRLRVTVAAPSCDRESDCRLPWAQPMWPGDGTGRAGEGWRRRGGVDRRVFSLAGRTRRHPSDAARRRHPYCPLLFAYPRLRPAAGPCAPS